jgi:CPA1 family monovalent cation:H+ antiporter
MLIGLQLPYITSEIEGVSLGDAIWYGVVISLVLIVTRICCTLGAAVFTRIAGHFITVADRRPGWKIPVAFGWAGMRGVVSLAAALSIPVVLQNGEPFPYRNLILVITFVVILVTLVVQGMTLPFVIRKLNLNNESAMIKEQEQELTIRRVMAEKSLHFLEQSHGGDAGMNEHLRNLAARLRADVSMFQKDLQEFNNTGRSLLVQYQNIYSALLEEQRKALVELNQQEGYDEELVRKYLSLVDLEETKLKELAVRS